MPAILAGTPAARRAAVGRPSGQLSASVHAGRKAHLGERLRLVVQVATGLVQPVGERRQRVRLIHRRARLRAPPPRAPSPPASRPAARAAPARGWPPPKAPARARRGRPPPACSAGQIFARGLVAGFGGGRGQRAGALAHGDNVDALQLAAQLAAANRQRQHLARHLLGESLRACARRAAPRPGRRQSDRGRAPPAPRAPAPARPDRPASPAPRPAPAPAAGRGCVRCARQ